MRYYKPNNPDLDPKFCLNPDLDPGQHRCALIFCGELDQEAGACEAQDGAVEGRGRPQWRRAGPRWSPGVPVYRISVVLNSHCFDEEHFQDSH